MHISVLMVLFCPRILSQYHISISLYFSLGSLRLVVSQTLLVLDDLDSVKEHSSGVLKEVPQLGFVSCFSWSYKVIYFGQKDHGSKVLFLSRHIEGTSYEHELSPLILLILDHLAEALFLRFSTLRFFIPFPFSILYSLGGWY
jgi:hypothetical protein